MKSTHWLLALLLLWSSPSWAGEDRTQTFMVGADVDAQGAVTQTQVEPDVNKSIAAVLDLAIKHWAFVPVQRNGKALPVHTFVEARFEAVADAAGKYSLTVSYVSQGPYWNNKIAPHYPEDAVRARAEGGVVVFGDLLASGKLIITDAKPLLGERASGHIASLFVQSTEEKLQKSRFVPEQVDGKPVPAHFRIHVNFSLNSASNLPVRKGPRAVASGGYCGTDASTINDRPRLSAMDPVMRQLLMKTQFDVGADADRSWRSGFSSVLQPRVINSITMHL